MEARASAKPFAPSAAPLKASLPARSTTLRHRPEKRRDSLVRGSETEGFEHLVTDAPEHFRRLHEALRLERRPERL